MPSRIYFMNDKLSQVSGRKSTLWQKFEATEDDQIDQKEEHKRWVR